MSIDELCEDWLADHARGAAVLVVQGGRVVHKRGYGVVDEEGEHEPDADTRFELASVSKHFTATAIMMLAERGELDYDESINTYFDFPAYGDDVTIRHLLHHTGGLTDYFALWANDEDTSRWNDEDEPGVSDIVDALATVEELDFEPGEKYDYSNSGYVVLAAIVAQVSGKPFPQFMEEEVFGPLGMTRTFVKCGEEEPDDNRAVGYEHGVPYEVHALDAAHGDGGIVTTLNDMQKWNAALDANELITAETQALAWTSGTTNDGEETGYGFGWEPGEASDGSPCYYHEGEYGGFSAFIRKDPDADGLAIVILSNADEADPEVLATAIADHMVAVS